MGSQIEDLMAKTIEYAVKIGASFAEAKGEDTRTLNVEAVNKELRTVSDVRNLGIGVRIFYGKKQRIFFFKCS